MLLCSTAYTSVPVVLVKHCAAAGIQPLLLLLQLLTSAATSSCRSRFQLTFPRGVVKQKGAL
jgi:hypothetical protein